MKRGVRVFSLGVMCMLLTDALASALLPTAQISGRVTDQNGDVLPGAAVTATHTDTGFTRTGVTDANCLYVLSALPTGPYQLHVSLVGRR